MRRTPMRHRYRDTGPTAVVVALVLSRDLCSCVVCGKELFGERGTDWSCQHRTGRRAGGTRRPWVNQPGNLVAIHGSGTSGCHGEVEGHPAWAEEYGWRVRDGVTRPSEVVMLHAPRGLWLYVDDAGGVSEQPPEVAA